MPAIAAVGATLATAASSAMAAIGPITLAGLAQGAAIVGTGLSVVGSMTGSKTLSKIGMGMSIAGGIGMLGAGIRGAAGAAGSLSASGKAGLLASTDEALAVPTKGTGLKSFPSYGADKSATPSANSFIKGSDAITGTFDPELEKNYFQRANDTLTKYNTLLNVAGGAGQAYMQGQHMQLQKDLQGNQLKFDQQLVDRVNRNNGTVLTGINPALGAANTVRDPHAYSGILRGN